MPCHRAGRGGPPVARRPLLGLASALPLLLALRPWRAAASGGDFVRLPKAMWVWRLDPSGLAALGEFARRQGITRALISLGASWRARLAAGDRGEIERLRTLAAGGLSLVALAGDAAWARRPRPLPRALDELAAIQARHGLFEALHLDVEPHTLEEWRSTKEARARLMAGLVDLLDAVHARLPQWPLEIALHPLHAQAPLPDGTNALEAIARRVVVACLMAYRIGAHRIIERALPGIAVLGRLDKPWRIGVMVHASDEAGATYFGLSREHLVTDMLELDRLARAVPGAQRQYRGLIFEDYNGLRKMLGG
jgi:hypothetical protein